MIGFRACCATAALHPRQNAAARAIATSTRLFDVITASTEIRRVNEKGPHAGRVRGRLLAQRHDADREDVAVLGWNGEAALLHQPANERRGLGIRRGRLHADADEALGV